MARPEVPRSPLDPRYRRATRRMLEAACLVAEGRSYAEVAKALNPPTSTKSVQNWMSHPECKQMYLTCMQRKMTSAFAKAARVMETQLDSSDPWIQHNAARECLTRFTEPVMGAQEREVTIKFADGQTMPQIGMPKPPDDATD